MDLICGFLFGGQQPRVGVGVSFHYRKSNEIPV
jgi:hypothetical protein